MSYQTKRDMEDEFENLRDELDGISVVQMPGQLARRIHELILTTVRHELAEQRAADEADPVQGEVGLTSSRENAGQ